MKHSELVRTAARLMEAQEPFLVTGPPGGGKTAGLVQACAVAKRRCLISHPVVSEEVDYRGLPGFIRKGQEEELRAVFLPFGFLRDLCETDEPTTCIFDDVGQARLSVQAALMQLIHLREVDGTKISDTVSFAMATNRREDRAAVTGFVSALLDRCVCVLPLDFDADELAKYLIKKGYPTILAGFIRWKPNSVRFESKDEFVKCPTPRSIEGLARMLALGMDSTELVTASVGPSFASEFLSFRKLESKLPSVADILAKPKTTKVPEERDVLYALMASLAGKLEAKNIAPGLDYLERVPPEFAVMVMKDVVEKVPDVEQVPAFVKWARANAKLLGV